MLDKFFTTIGRITIRQHFAVVFVAVLVYGFLFIDALLIDDERAGAEQVVEISAGPALVASLPERIRIPTVDINATFGPELGVTRIKEIEVPKTYSDVGYYKYGPTPGELGPAVVLGHVDSYQGPAVFWSLQNIKEGDVIYIDRADGTVATFTVDRISEHTQDGFPTEEVFNDIEYAGLRLVTCSGVYSHRTQMYSHNLIVYAKLTE